MNLLDIQNKINKTSITKLTVEELKARLIKEFPDAEIEIVLNPSPVMNEHLVSLVLHGCAISACIDPDNFAVTDIWQDGKTIH